MSADRTDGRGVQTIEVGMRILEALTGASEPIKLRDVARAAGVAPAQAHAYLLSFRRQSMVEQDEATGLYRLGELALQLAIARMRGFDPVRRGCEAVLELATQSRLTTGLSVWGSFGATVVYVHEGGDQIHVNIRAGSVYSLTGTASGRVFAAHLPEHKVHKAIEAEAAEPPTTPRVGARLPFSAIRDRLPEIRRRGYSATDPPPVPEIHAVAAPVFDYAGQIRMVVTLMGTESLIDAPREGRHVEAVLACARRLNEQMGYAGTESMPPEPKPPDPTGRSQGAVR